MINVIKIFNVLLMIDILFCSVTRKSLEFYTRNVTSVSTMQLRKINLDFSANSKFVKKVYRTCTYDFV